MLGPKTSLIDRGLEPLDHLSHGLCFHANEAVVVEGLTGVTHRVFATVHFDVFLDRCQRQALNQTLGGIGGCDAAAVLLVVINQYRNRDLLKRDIAH